MLKSNFEGSISITDRTDWSDVWSFLMLCITGLSYFSSYIVVLFFQQEGAHHMCPFLLLLHSFFWHWKRWRSLSSSTEHLFMFRNVQVWLKDLTNVNKIYFDDEMKTVISSVIWVFPFDQHTSYVQRRRQLSYLK